MSRQFQRLVWASLFTVIVMAGLIPAQPETKKQSQPAAAPPQSLSIRFTNGTMVQQAVLLDAVEMETKLGKLSIPAHEIQRIDFGFRVSEEDAKKLEQAMKDLASEKHANREIATKTLLGMGKLAYPTLIENRKKGDLEMIRRVDGLIKDIQGKFSVENLHTRRTDILRTADSVVAGRVTSEHLRIKTDIFGETKVPLWRLRDLRSMLPGSEVMVAVDSNKYGNRMSWLETEFEVVLGTKVEITATGEINLDPLNTLGGNVNARNVQPRGTTGLVSGEGFIPGQLVGKVGDGPIFVIGAKHTLTPNREGKLYVRIVTIEHASNVKAEGNYNVRIAAEPGGP
jgi:hypothetical protein